MFEFVLVLKCWCAHTYTYCKVVCIVSGSRGQISLSWIALMHSALIEADSGSGLLTVGQFMQRANGATCIKNGGLWRNQSDRVKVEMGLINLQSYPGLSAGVADTALVTEFTESTMIRKRSGHLETGFLSTIPLWLCHRWGTFLVHSQSQIKQWFARGHKNRHGLCQRSHAGDVILEEIMFSTGRL